MASTACCNCCVLGIGDEDKSPGASHPRRSSSSSSSSSSPGRFLAGEAARFRFPSRPPPPPQGSPGLPSGQCTESKCECLGVAGRSPALWAARQCLREMDKSPSWFPKLPAWKDAVEEGQPIVQKDQCAEKDESCYGSINGGETADVSCVPCPSFSSRGSVTCPTCQGTGRIPREQEQQLVALIPYGDQRLKPRRTKLYVTITVALCLLITCLMMYFLFPRSIAVVPAGLSASAVSFDNSSYSIILNMTNMLNVTNNNFYTVHVAQLDIEVLHKTLVIGKSTAMTHLDIQPLQGAQILYTVSSTIMDNNTYNICTWSRIKVHNVLLHIQGTLTCSYLSHSEQLAFENYQYVDCRGNATLPRLSRSQRSLQQS
uniref:transmembrane protein 106A n=1 Tax=Euleptes europaea TaxID=460621 RepID=UPI002542197D|nr:transmembrane protein 106A [Euleptes europaea]